MKLSIDRELDWFRNLAGGFSVFSGYDGYEIAQVELERGIKEELPVCEEKKRDRYAMLMVSKNGKQMTMKLIRPKETVEQISESRMEGAHPVQEPSNSSRRCRKTGLVCNRYSQVYGGSR